jgi:hypothetical protein
VGLLLSIVLFAGSVALLRAGIYGWTIFVVFPVLAIIHRIHQRVLEHIRVLSERSW